MSAESGHDVGRLIRITSVIVLSVVYGNLSVYKGWFPAKSIRQALIQLHERIHGPTIGPPAVYADSGVLVNRHTGAEPNPTLITSKWGDNWQRGIRLISADGQILHHWDIGIEPFVGDDPQVAPLRAPQESALHGSHLLPTGDVIVNLNYIGTVRFDACGEVVWKLSRPTHHSVAVTGEGSVWIPYAVETELASTEGRISGISGLPDTIYEDKLLKVGMSGQIQDSISLLDVISKNDLTHYIPKHHNEDSQNEITIDPDLLHLNDIEPLSARMASQYADFEPGYLLISMRALDLILVLDPNSSKVVWSASEPFIHQHDPDYLGDGWIGVFDNRHDGTDRGTMLGGSRILALKPGSDSTKVLFPTSTSDPFYTPVQGKWQLLRNDNLLLTESQAGRVIEVNPQGETVWEWIQTPRIADVVRIPSVTEATRYNLTQEQVSSWPCSLDAAPKG